MDGTFVKQLDQSLKKPLVLKADGCDYIGIPELSPDNTQRWNIQGGRLGWGADGHYALEPMPDLIGVPTLSGLVSYLKANPDQLELERLLVVIRSPVQVDVFGALLKESAQRSSYFSALMPRHNGFPYGEWLDPNSFVQMIQTLFTESPDLQDLLVWTSTMQSAATIVQADDGVTQTVSIQSGTSLCKRVPIRSVLALYPRGQTFPEIEPLPLQTIFRVHGGSETKPPSCGLFCGAPSEWAAAACESIAAWLRGRLGDSCKVIG